LGRNLSFYAEDVKQMFRPAVVIGILPRFARFCTMMVKNGLRAAGNTVRPVELVACSGGIVI